MYCLKMKGFGQTAFGRREGIVQQYEKEVREE